MSKSKSSAWPHCELPVSLVAERQGEIAILKLNRPEKRNAFNPPLVRGIETFFTSLPDDSTSRSLTKPGLNREFWNTSSLRILRAIGR